MIITVTAQEIKEVRDKYQCSLLEAKRIAWRSALLTASDRAQNVDDLRHVIKAVIKGEHL